MTAGSGVPAGKSRIERLLDEALAREPLDGDVALAVALSVATRIEPELVRAIRLDALPHLDVGAESDFWFSEWIGPRQPHVVALRPELLPRLREHLRIMLGRGKDQPIHRLRRTIKRVHTNISPALALEETIYWICCTGGSGGRRWAGVLLRGPTKAMEDGRVGVADWVAGALHRLPREVVGSVAGWHLLMGARAHLGDDIVLAGSEVAELTERASQPESSDLIGEVFGPFARFDDERARQVVGLRWQGDILVLGATPGSGTFSIDLPDGVPPLVQVIPIGAITGPWYHVEAGEERRHDSEGRDLRLRTVDGRYYDLPRAVGDSVHAAPVLVRVAVGAARQAVFWLQPVSFNATEHGRLEQPIALLNRVRRVLPADPDALAELVAWRSGEARVGVRLLCGAAEDHRIRVADQFAADCERAQWTVYRARQDPDASAWLTEDGPLSGPAGTVVVVDRADSWHPRQLAALLPRFGGVRVRMLILTETSGRWMTELALILGSGAALDTQALDPLPRRSWAPDQVFRRALEVVADALELPDIGLLDVQMRRSGPGDGLSDQDVEVIAVASALDAITKRRRFVPPDEATATILRHEHAYRRSRRANLRDDEDPELLARLVFLVALMRPCGHAIALDVCVHFGLISRGEQWLRLLNQYESYYRSAPGFLEPIGNDRLADELLAAALLEPASEVGIDREWAVEVVGRLPELAGEHGEQGLANALTVLARAARRFPALALNHLHPIIRAQPGLLIRAGGPALAALVRNAKHGLVEFELLDRVHAALPPAENRGVDLDVAAHDLEELLVARALRQGAPSPARDAPLYLRLADSRYRAGLLRSALDAAGSAVEAYRDLTAAGARATHAVAFSEALIRMSVILGELGQPNRALALAEEAVTRRRALERRFGGEFNLGSALANLAKQKGDHGKQPGALDDATDAVNVLSRLAGVNRAYQPDLADALVVKAERVAEEHGPEAALVIADSAVDLCSTLIKQNEWAHGHRLAAALLCRAAFHGRVGDHTAALADIEPAVELLGKAMSASPERFRPRLASALLQRARSLAAVQRWSEVRADAERAISLLGAAAETNPGAYAKLREKARDLARQADAAER